MGVTAPEPRPRPSFTRGTSGAHYHQELLSGSLPNRLRSVVEALGPPPGRLLDIGCHTGSLAIELQRVGWTVKGMEPNADAAEIAQFNGLAVINGSAEEASSWQTVGGDLDGILLLDVLEHTYDPWKVLEVARAHLKTSGRVFVTLPNVASWKILRPLILQRQFVPPSTGLDDPTHVRFFTLRDAVELLGSTGYRCVDVRPGWTSIPGSHRLRRCPSIEHLWSGAWLRWAPSLAIAVPLLIAQPA